MTALDTPRQLRPMLLRFKRMADRGLVDNVQAVARHFDISPRRPSNRGRDFVMWHPCNLGRIAGAFDIVLGMECNDAAQDQLIVLPKFRVAAPYGVMLFHLTAVFGAVDPQFSKTGRGRWIEYRPAAAPNCNLIVAFDSPTKREKHTRLSAAIFNWRPSLLRNPVRPPS